MEQGEDGTNEFAIYMGNPRTVRDDNTLGYVAIVSLGFLCLNLVSYVVFEFSLLLMFHLRFFFTSGLGVLPRYLRSYLAVWILVSTKDQFKWFPS